MFIKGQALVMGMQKEAKESLCPKAPHSLMVERTCK